MRFLIAATLIICCSISPAIALDQGYWVVVGNLPENTADLAAHDTIEANARKCGFKTFNDFSLKFGFKPGYESFVLGAYATRGEAKAVLASVQRCVPDAYIKRGAYLGE